MTLYILDTDHASLFQRGHTQIIQRVAGLEPTPLQDWTQT